MFNKDNEKYLFTRGLIFIALAYISILCINNYTYFLNIAAQGLSIIKPFIVAFLLAYLMHPLVKSLEEVLKVKRGYCIGLVYLALISALALAINFILPVVTNSLSQILKDLPIYLNQLGDLLQNITSNSDLPISTIINNATTEICLFLKDNFSTYLTSAVGTTISAVSLIFNTFISLVAAFYVLLEKENIFKVFSLVSLKLFGSKIHNGISTLLRSLHTNIGKYLVGKGINSLFISIFAFIGLSLLKSKYAVLLSIFLGCTNMIPYIGPILGTVVAVTLNIFSNPTTTLFIVIYLFIIQQIESFVLEPKLIGERFGLSPLLTIFSVSVFGSLFGMVGMILGVPIMSLIKHYANKFLNSDNDVPVETK